MKRYSRSSLLYLDGVAVSFDGFKALRGLSLTLAPGEMRAIIGPNGAGKTTMMDVITGKTRPDEGIVLFGGTHDLTQAGRGHDRRTRHRPQVPEADGVRKPDGRGQYPARAEGAAHGARDAVRQAGAPTRREQIDRILETTKLGDHRARMAGRSLARPEAMAGDRHAAGAGPEAAAGRRTRRRHDRRRDRCRPPTCCGASRRIIPSSWSSTTWISCANSTCKVTVLHEGAVLAEGPLDQVQRRPAVIEVYLGR